MQTRARESEGERGEGERESNFDCSSPACFRQLIAPHKNFKPVRHRAAEHHTCLAGLATRAQQQPQQQQQQRQQQHKQRDVTEGQTAGLVRGGKPDRQIEASRLTFYRSFVADVTVSGSSPCMMNLPGEAPPIIKIVVKHAAAAAAPLFQRNVVQL